MRDRRSFGHVLTALQRSRLELRQVAPAAGLFANPLAATALPIQGRAADPGVADLWERAVAWAPASETGDRQDVPISGPATPAPSDEVGTIECELGLASDSTPEHIARARRRFMWKNHPDRCAEMSRGPANRRVAIANMLIDRALAAVSKRRRPI